MKKVSVLMTVYNGVEYLKDSIDSILNQSYEEFDFIIIDDKSVDGSLDFIKSIKDSRITVVRNNENIGQTKSLNKGVEYCDSEYILRMDADDVSKLNRLEIQLNHVQDNQVQLLGSGVNLISPKGDFIKSYKGEMDIHERPSKNSEIQWYSLFESPISGGTFLFEKSKLKKLGGYNEKIRFCQDYHLASLFAFHCKTENYKENLLNVRIHENSSTNSYSDVMRIEAREISKENILRHFPEIKKSKCYNLIEKIRTKPSLDRFLVITELIKQFLKKDPNIITNLFITQHASIEIFRCLQNLENKVRLIEKYIHPIHEELALLTESKFH